MQYVACNLCGATETRLRFPSTISDDTAPRSPEAFRCTHSGYGRHHLIVQCASCGLVYTNPRLDSAQILDSYVAVEDPLYLQEREGRVLTFERHLRPLEQLKPPPGRLLDIGAYTGVFVEIARRHGWDAWGLEPSHWAVSEARKQGLQMIEGTLESVDLPAASFDLVTMWDVIEHVTDPLGEFARVRRLLKPNGVLAVHTMDIDSLFARIMGERAVRSIAAVPAGPGSAAPLADTSIHPGACATSVSRVGWMPVNSATGRGRRGTVPISDVAPSSPDS